MTQVHNVAGLSVKVVGPGEGYNSSSLRRDSDGDLFVFHDVNVNVTFEIGDCQLIGSWAPGKREWYAGGQSQIVAYDDHLRICNSGAITSPALLDIYFFDEHSDESVLESIREACPALDAAEKIIALRDFIKSQEPISASSHIDDGISDDVADYEEEAS